ncbi:MAG: hypothetical protein L3J34_05670 [Flavobacteriaceae bacterium]|nr:hypothetical protein [Flavobacteriaceae bacterium]
MQEKNKNIDKFIRDGMNLESASLDFSNKIMSQIHVAETEKEKALSTILQKYTHEEPSVYFAQNILSKIEMSASSTKYEPIISKKVWYFVITFLLAIMIYVASFIEETSSQLKIVNENIHKIGDLFLFELPEIISSPVLALSLFALSSLLFLDYFFQNRKFS